MDEFVLVTCGTVENCIILPVVFARYGQSKPNRPCPGRLPNSLQGSNGRAAPRIRHLRTAHQLSDCFERHRTNAPNAIASPLGRADGAIDPRTQRTLWGFQLEMPGSHSTP
jgi:hypothetical protein